MFRPRRFTPALALTAASLTLLAVVVVAASAAGPPAGRGTATPAGKAATGRQAPLDRAFVQYQRQVALRRTSGFRLVSGRASGVIPAPMDISYLAGERIAPRGRTYAASFDLRTQNKVSPVKDQGQYGACWSFSTMASLESCLLPGELRDFSEDNLVLNSGFDTGGDPYNHGGNLWMSSAYLVRWSGPVDESQDAYGDSVTPPGLTAVKHVQEIRYIPGGSSATDNGNIKYALTTWGAVATSIFWQDAGYASSTAAYYYSGSASTNHGVTIVGWDDDFPASSFLVPPPGSGAWLVKNSWGTGWGQSGFFWVSYYDTYCGTSKVRNGCFDVAQPTTSYDDLYFYDPLGEVSNYGYSSTTAYGANVFTAHAPESVKAVGFFAPTANTSYTVYAGTSLDSLQARGTGTLSTPGFFTVQLSTPLAVSTGAQFTVAVKLTTPGYNYPLTIEYADAGYSSQATASPGQSYTSAGGSGWSDLTSWKSTANLCLKAYASAGSSPSPSPSPSKSASPSPTPSPSPSSSKSPSPSPSPSPSKSASPSPTPSPSPTAGADDDIPGVVLPASPVVGVVAAGGDLDDVFRVVLDAGQTLKATIVGPFGSDLRLYLYGPGTASVKDPDTPYLALARGAYPASFSYIADEDGTYYLDVYAYAGGGAYSVSYTISSAGDETGPVCAAKNARVRHGGTVKLYLRVHDARSGQVTKHLAITTRSGRVVKRWNADYDENYDGWWWIKYKCTLARGTYRIVVTGEDLAGNHASKVGRATLTVY
jgi:C1A family cysteine protease